MPSKLSLEFESNVCFQSLLLVGLVAVLLLSPSA